MSITFASLIIYANVTLYTHYLIIIGTRKYTCTTCNNSKSIMPTMRFRSPEGLDNRACRRCQGQNFKAVADDRPTGEGHKATHYCHIGCSDMLPSSLLLHLWAQSLASANPQPSLPSPLLLANNNMRACECLYADDRLRPCAIFM